MMQKVPITELALVARDAAELLRGPSALAGGDAAFLALSRLRRIDGPFSHIAFSNETSQLMDAIVTSLNTYPDVWETRNLGRCAEELTRFAKLAGLRQQQIRFFESTKVRRAMRHLTLAFVPRVSKVLPAPLAGICGALARAQIRYEPIFKSVGGWLVAVDNVHRGFGPKDFNMGVFLTSKPPEEGAIAAAALQYDVLGKSLVKDKQFGSSSSASTSSRSDSDHRLLVERALFTEKEGEDGEYSECEKTVSDWVGSQWPGIVERFWKRCDEAGVFRELALGKQQQRQSFQRSPLQGTPTPVLLNLLWAFSKTKMPVEQYGPIYAVLLRRLLLVECGNTWDRHALQGFAAEARFSSEGINHGSSSSSEDQSLNNKTSISDWRNRDAAEILPVRTSLLASSLAALSSIPIDKRLLGPIGEASWLTAVRRRSRVGKAQQLSTPSNGFAGPTGAAHALEEASLPQLKALATSLALKQLSASSEFAAPRHAAVAARVVISLGVADTVEGSAALSLIVDRARTLLSPQEVPDQHSFISAFSPGELAPTLSALGALVRASAPARSSQRLRKIKQSTQLDRLLKSDAQILSFLLLFSSSIRVSSLDEFRRVDAVSTIASAAAAAEDEDIDGDGSLSSVVIDALPSSAVEETTDKEGRLIAYGDSTSGSGSGSEGSEMRRFLRRQQRAASIHSPQIPTSDLSANGGCGPLHSSLIEQIRLLFTLSKECVMGNVGRISAQQFVHLVCSHAAICMPLTPLTLHVCNLIQSRPEWTQGLSNEHLVDLAWGLSCSVGNEGADAAATFRSHSTVSGGGDKANSLEDVSSHRRTLASKRVGNTSVPVVILPRDVLLSTNLAVDTNETQGRASKRSLLLEERRISHEANSIGFGLSAVKKNSPRGALCAIADRLMSTSASSLTPSEMSTLAWSLSIAGVYHCGLFDAIAKSLLSPSATVSKEEKTHSSHSVGSKTLQQQYQDDVVGLSSWTTQNLEQLGVAASFLAVRQFPALDEELRNQDSAYKWKEPLIQIAMAVNDELKQRSSSPFILVNNNDDNEEEEEEEEEEDRISDVEAVAEAVTFPEFNQATGASTIIRVTSLLLQKSVSKPVVIDGVESESIGDRLMCSILDDNDDKGGDTASKQMNDPLFLQLRQKLSFIRKDDEVEGDIRLHKQIEDVLLAFFDSKSEVPEQEKKSSTINAASSKPAIFHHYQALGGSIVIPIAVPSKKIAIYFEEIPDYVDSLLPEPITSAYQKWSTNAIQLAGWTVISFGKTAFLGASGLTGKVRILEVGGLTQCSGLFRKNSV